MSRRGHDGSYICPHRDISCCPKCFAEHEELVDVGGVTFWISDPAEREQTRKDMAAVPQPVVPGTAHDRERVRNGADGWYAHPFIGGWSPWLRQGSRGSSLSVDPFATRSECEEFIRTHIGPGAVLHLDD